MIIVNEQGIFVQNGNEASIVMIGPAVTIDEGALLRNRPGITSRFHDLLGIAR